MSTETAARAYPIDVDLYLKIEATGVLGDRRFELIDGLLVPMSPMSEEHEWATAMLGRHFVLGLAAFPDFVVAQQGGIVADETSVPQPDLMVKTRARYSPRRPNPHRPPSEPGLVGEVSYSSAVWDLGRKRRLYAEAGVPEYWVIDIPGERLVVHRDPVYGDYRTITEHRRGEPVAPAGLPVPPFDVAVALDPPA